MGISPATLYKWKNEHLEFSEALKRGKSPVDFEIENMLLKRAKGYEYEETVEEVTEAPNGEKTKHKRITKKHMPPDTTALIYWLKNRKPEQWRDRREIAVAESALSAADEMLAVIRSAAENESRTDKETG